MHPAPGDGKEITQASASGRGFIPSQRPLTLRWEIRPASQRHFGRRLNTRRSSATRCCRASRQPTLTPSMTRPWHGVGRLWRRRRGSKRLRGAIGRRGKQRPLLWRALHGHAGDSGPLAYLENAFDADPAGYVDFIMDWTSEQISKAEDSGPIRAAVRAVRNDPVGHRRADHRPLLRNAGSRAVPGAQGATGGPGVADGDVGRLAGRSRAGCGPGRTDGGSGGRPIASPQLAMNVRESPWLAVIRQVKQRLANPLHRAGDRDHVRRRITPGNGRFEDQRTLQ
jgi:hypothetical protein